MNARNTIKTIGGVAGAVAALGVAATAYALAARPRMLRWGATPDEVERVYPGDEFVLNPQIKATHGVTVHAAPENIFPWLIQMGQGRAGFYSLESIENRLFQLDIHNADHIIPEFQSLKVGDKVPFGKGIAARVAILEPDKQLVLRGTIYGPEIGEEGEPTLKPGESLNATWGFFLEPLENGDTRLIERFRVEYTPTLVNHLAYYGFVEPGAFVMERSMLQGIKARAEGVFGKALIERQPLVDRVVKPFRGVRLQSVWQRIGKLQAKKEPQPAVVEPEVIAS